MVKPKLLLPTNKKSYGCLKVVVASNFLKDVVDIEDTNSDRKAVRYDGLSLLLELSQKLLIIFLSGSWLILHILKFVFADLASTKLDPNLCFCSISLILENFTFTDNCFSKIQFLVA